MDFYRNSNEQLIKQSFTTNDDISLRLGQNTIYTITRPFAYEQNEDDRVINCQYIFKGSR